MLWGQIGGSGAKRQGSGAMIGGSWAKIGGFEVKIGGYREKNGAIGLRLGALCPRLRPFVSRLKPLWPGFGVLSRAEIQASGAMLGGSGAKISPIFSNYGNLRIFLFSKLFCTHVNHISVGKHINFHDLGQGRSEDF